MKSLLDKLDCHDEQTIVDAFTHRYAVSNDEATIIFNETKKLLWLAANIPTTHAEGIFIDTPLSILDKMWHNFILHTKIYYQYCMDKFGCIIHHLPSNHEKEDTYNKSYRTNSEEYECLVKKQYSLIYEYLGAETLVKWYDTFASKYTPQKIRDITLKSD